MQQYFVQGKLNIGDEIVLDDEIIYHIRKVLRKNDGFMFRICADKTVFLAELKKDRALIREVLDEDNELKCDITVIMSLIKNDKWDLTLQKLTELGVKRIVPYEARRSVVRKGDLKKLERFRKIVREAAEQSHRNVIPEVTDYLDIKEIEKYKSEYNYFAYEKQDSNVIPENFGKSVTFVIGPEGGFAEEEVKLFEEHGFKIISLGKRILRAETAAIFMASIISGREI